MSEQIRDGILFVTGPLSDPYAGSGNPTPNPKEGLEIKITKYEVPLDPHIEVFSVEIEDDKSTWMETIPSEENLRWFLRGVQAGASTFGNKHVSLPEIPRNTEPISKG